MNAQSWKHGYHVFGGYMRFPRWQVRTESVLTSSKPKAVDKDRPRRRAQEGEHRSGEDGRQRHEPSPIEPVDFALVPESCPF